MAFTLLALKTELLTDPTSIYGTNVQTRDDSIVAQIINQPRAAIRIRRADILSSEVVNAIDVADYTPLPVNPNSTAQSIERRYLSWLECVSGLPSIRLLNDDGTDAPAIANFKAMFINGSTQSPTYIRLTALATRDGSRSEQLFGLSVTVADVTNALNL